MRAAHLRDWPHLSEQIKALAQQHAPVILALLPLV